MDFEKIYLSMMGELVQPLEGISDAFAPGQLCERLGEDEDADLECILDCFFEINRDLCQRMYHLGAAHTARTQNS